MPSAFSNLPFLVVGALLVTAGCTAQEEDPPSTGRTPAADRSPATTAVTEPSTGAAIFGEFPAGDGGAAMTIECTGSGTPAVVLVSGDDSGREVFPRSMVDALAEHHLTCGYDRVGTGESDPPTSERRSLADVADDLDRLLEQAGVPGPYALAGSSGGGMIAVEFAARHPDETAAIALLDVGVPNPHLDREFPGAEGWAGPEHIDWVAGEKRMAELAMPLGDEPVLVLAAEDSEDGHPAGQRYWLGLSPRATFEVVPGDHDFYEQYPTETAGRVERMLAG